MKRGFFLIIIGVFVLQSCSRVKDHFTIIGKTIGLKDSTLLYLRDAKSTSLLDNLDSTYIVNNSFKFMGSVSEPKELMIHTGYTGWEDEPPESFHYVMFLVDNSTIYLKDDIGNLTYSTFSGSKIQNDNTDYIKSVKKYLMKDDSISKVFKNLTLADSLTAKFLRKENQRNYAALNEANSIFITTHPKSLLSILNLNGLKRVFGKGKTKYLYSLLIPEIQNTSYGKSVKEYIEVPDYVKNFGDLNDLELPDLNGKLIKLSALNAKYILLEFWASWCGPCRSENPNLSRLYNTYKPRGFEIYAVSLDGKKEDWQKAVTDDNIAWITVSDLKGEDSNAATIYEVTAIPKNYLVDMKGKIIAENIRGEELANKLAEIFNKQ